MNHEHRDWSAEDSELEQEFADVIPLIRESETAVPPLSRSVRHQVLAMASPADSDRLQNHWILGQGPSVIMVTLILFAVAMMVYFIR